MLFLVVLLTLSSFITTGNSINLTYVLKKGKNIIQPSCIAEENERYSAIGWVFPLPSTSTNLPEIVTKFLPNITSSYNCNFEPNEKCNGVWSISGWQIEDKGLQTHELLLDRRWEDLPVLLTSQAMKEFEHKIEVNSVFRVGFSVMATKDVEILLCDGWNPYNYACYHLNISTTEIYLRKFAKLPQNDTNQQRPIDSYKAFSSILSDQEWRNFIISRDENGRIQLLDVIVNRTVIDFTDKDDLQPLYLLIRSQHSAAWKIHQNSFMYTKTEQFSRLGPLLRMSTKNLCISLMISMCNNCTMQFKTRVGGEIKILKEILPWATEFDWRSIKLKYENFPDDNITIFIQTKFVNDAKNQTEGFWAYDDVRVCHENEVKVTFLNVKSENVLNDKFIDGISCQVIQKPKWRPQRIVYPEILDFPLIESKSEEKSIKLSWTQEDPNKRISYFITYEGNDVCSSYPYNIQRLKSNGFLITKQNEIVIENLIPYTKYNISVTSVFHEKEKKHFVTTLESEEVQPEELPNNIQIQVTDTTATISWDKINCQSIYGHIIYNISLTNLKTNTTRQIKVQTDNAIEIFDLEPFTLYKLNIITARNLANLNKPTNFPMTINFQTKAGLAPTVQNLEVYATDSDSVSLRYDLPKSAHGVPVFIQVVRCFPLLYKKCKSLTSKITACNLWPDKYCVDVNNIAPHMNHTFKISIKNDETSDFGDEVVVSAETIDRIPEAPTNITYKIVDCKEGSEYCHLNVSWLHPYHPNGTINSFFIKLNSTDNEINEIYKIHNKTYQSQYEKQIQYIPYSTNFDIYIQSANLKYKSDFSHKFIQTAEIGDYINQTPNLTIKTENSAKFKLAPLDYRLKSYTVNVFIQNFDKNIKIPEDILKTKMADHLCHNYGKTWLEQTIEINNNETNTIFIDNKLEPNTKYCITFIITNKYKNGEHDVVYYKEIQTDAKIEASTGSYNHLYVLLLLLLLVPVGFLLYRYYRKKNRKPKITNENNKENEYETLPFDECEFNCANNENYDHLLHK